MTYIDQPMKVDRPSDAQIRARAYAIYLQHGCQAGHDIDDWLQAEYELMQLPTEKIAELPPPKATRSRVTKKSLVSLVQAAMVLAAASMNR